MPSLVPGYDYDIFISYRQKDNKYDGWVTEFVNNLKRELEATLKEEVSVYFDINPHDGLLETHDVNASLKEKLRCLVFIPVISQTYCDPKSFAWEHEFREFIRLASGDRFGKKIKLAGGNVASRILPVRIHDLSGEDMELLERELGDVPRPIDFIYKAPGVNRPLRFNEEHPDENLNHVIYRDQINKTANAIRDLLYSIVSPQKAVSPVTGGRPTPERKQGRPVKKEWYRNRLFLGLIAIILLALAVGITKLTAGRTLSNSILVMPFKTHETSQDYFAEGIAVDVITELAKIRDITTLSWNTSMSYSGTTKPLKEIARATGVSYVLTGIIQRDQGKVRVNVELVSPGTGRIIWARSWDEELKLIFDIQKQIAKEVARELGVKLSTEEYSRLDRYQTRNFEAYDLFLKARAESRKIKWDRAYLVKSNEHLDEALAIEPDFPQALTLRANNLTDITAYDEVDPLEQASKARKVLEKSLALDPGYSDTWIVLGIVNWFLEWNFSEAKRNLEKGWELSNYGGAPITQCFCGIIEFNMARGDFRRALALLARVREIDPEYPLAGEESIMIHALMNDTAMIRKIADNYTGPGYNKASIFYVLGDYARAISILLQEPDLDSKSYWATPQSGLLASAYYRAGMTGKGDSLVTHLIDLSGYRRNIDFSLAAAFSARGDRANAIKWYKSAYRKHDLGIPTTLYNTDLKLIIDEPEIREILSRIGIIDTPVGK